MFPKIPLVKSAIERTFHADADIYAYQDITDEYNVTEQQREKLATVRCRIAYKSMGIAGDSDTADTQNSTIKMIYDCDGVQIPPGSYIHVIWDDGRVDDFENTSVPAIYTHHAEVSLKRARSRP